MTSLNVTSSIDSTPAPFHRQARLVYINHRPAFGLNPADLHRAFDVLADQLSPEDGQPEINRENLLFLLQQYGEHLSDYEMADCLSNLLQIPNASTEMFDVITADDAGT